MVGKSFQILNLENKEIRYVKILWIYWHFKNKSFILQGYALKKLK